MIALSIFGMTATVLLGLRNWDLDTRIFSQNVTLATLLVQEKMTEAELAIDGPPAFGTTRGEFEDRASGFVWQQTVSATPLTIDVREVKVRVSWGPDADDDRLSVLSESDEPEESADAVEAVAYYLFGP